MATVSSSNCSPSSEQAVRAPRVRRHPGPGGCRAEPGEEAQKRSEKVSKSGMAARSLGAWTNFRTRTYTALTPDRVLDALEAAGLEPDGRLLALNSYENRVYQVGMAEGPQ